MLSFAFSSTITTTTTPPPPHPPSKGDALKPTCKDGVLLPHARNGSFQRSYICCSPTMLDTSPAIEINIKKSLELTTQIGVAHSNYKLHAAGEPFPDRFVVGDFKEKQLPDFLPFASRQGFLRHHSLTNSRQQTCPNPDLMVQQTSRFAMECF